MAICVLTLTYKIMEAFMKSNVLIVVLMLSLISMFVFATPSNQPMLISENTIAAGHDLIVNGVVLTPSFDIDGQTVMVPLRVVSEALGYEVKWFASDRHIELNKGNRTIMVKTTENYYALGKMAPTQLASKAIIKKATTYVPLSFVSEMLDAFAHHNDAGVTIESHMGNTVSTSGFIITKIEGNRLFAKYLDGEAVMIVDDNTTYSRYNHQGILSLKDIKIGDTLKLTHPPMMLMIYPPQYAPSHIEVINDVAFTSGVISEIGEDWILVTGLQEDIRFNLSDETLYEPLFHRSITKDDLRLGNKVSAYHSLATTFSIPPQSSAIKIILE